MARPDDGWRTALGDARVLVSGFGKWGGGAYDLTSGSPEALDDLPTSGLAAGGGRLWRLRHRIGPFPARFGGRSRRFDLGARVRRRSRPAEEAEPDAAC